MEPATKRQKTTIGALADTDEDDELYLEPHELNQRRDPAFQLAKGRAKAANQLKSRFEDIFAKYERDFTGIGDEIDLATGEVIVDNGHLSSMRSMKDWIVDDVGDEEEEGFNEDDYGERGKEEQALSDDFGYNHPGVADGIPKDPWMISGLSWSQGSESRKPPALDSLLPTQPGASKPGQPFAHESSVMADPTWQAPELPRAAFSRTLGYNGRRDGGAGPVVNRTILRKSMKAPESPEADEEDDLQTVPGNAPKRKEIRDPQNTRQSPLINRKFPTVDSSPQDNGLNDLIKDVIENIPDTPPSIRRSTLSKSQGKTSPSDQKHRVRSRTKSKLRILDTPFNSHSQEVPKNRGMAHIARVDPVEEQETRNDATDQFSWEESDLESFLDVTKQGITKPAGQVLHVEIRARKFNTKDTATVDNFAGPRITMSDAEDKDRRVHAAVPVNKTGRTREPGKPKSQGSWKRNVVDPAFAFSDEEILLPKRSNKKRRQSEPVRHTIIRSPSISNLPKAARDMTKAVSDQLRVNHITTPAQPSLDQRRASKLPKSASPRFLSNSTSHNQSNSGAQHSQQLSPTDVDPDIDLGPQDSASMEQETEHLVAGEDTVASKFAKQSTARLATDQFESREEQTPAVGTTKVDERTHASTSSVRSRSSSLHPSPSALKLSPQPAEHQPAQPTTPRRPKSKRDEKTTISSFDTSLMSLLSDSDDDEDEISFDHSDFTPSGHHRILVHRPFPRLSTTPRFRTSSTTQKKTKRASLPYGLSQQWASSRRTSKTPQTPRSAASDGVTKSANHKQTHRKSHHQLARSVVRVSRRRDTDQDDDDKGREGSVVQTPGGSKRRCGADGWKCERDFCFVCME